MGRFYSPGDDPASDVNNPVIPHSLTRWPQDSDRVHDRGDASWRDAPIPRRWLRCTPWSTLYTPHDLVDAERCACGAIRLDGHGPWIYRNTRRHRETPNP
jgi:hypothetical protein